jgi:hypothetical protein
LLWQPVSNQSGRGQEQKCCKEKCHLSRNSALVQYNSEQSSCQNFEATLTPSQVMPIYKQIDYLSTKIKNQFPNQRSNCRTILRDKHKDW